MTNKLSIFAGTALIPTLARLVLGMSFMYAGASKLFKEMQFDAAQAKQLEKLGIRLAPAPEETAQGELPDGGVVLASYVQAENEEASGASGEVTELVDDAAAQNATETGGAEAAQEGEAAGPKYEGKQVNYLILTIDNKGMSYPAVMGWLAAITEFVGGVLILLGLFSRVWGLALATIMVVAVYMTTWEPLVAGKLFMMSPGDASHLMTQLGLFVLAFGVMLTGGGPLSLDRVLFVRKPLTVARRMPMADLEHEPDRSEIPMH